MEYKVYNTAAKEVGKMDLNSSVFEQEYNEPLIHQVVVAQLANKRQGTKSTLTRSEVRGGGAKPWRQKGTGRARQGSIRSPQWIKGGVVFAPKPRDFSQKINREMKLAAIKSVLSEKARSNEIIILDEFTLKSVKTKEVAKVLDNFNLNKKVLLVVAAGEANKDGIKAMYLASRNIPNVTMITSDLINVYDVVANGRCLITKEAIAKIEEAYV